MSNSELFSFLKKKKDDTITASPFADCYEDSKVIDWLQEHNLKIPSQRPSGRNLTSLELRDCLKREYLYVSYDMPLGGPWTARVREMFKEPQGDSRYRLMVVYARGYTDEDSPVTLSFSGNPDLVNSFLDKLTALCGPLVLMQEGGVKDIIGLTG